MDHVVSTEEDAQQMTGPQQRVQARRSGSRRRELLECVHDTKKYIDRAGRGVVKLFQQAFGDEDGRGLFQSKVELYLRKSLGSLLMLTMTACDADGMSDAEIDEFLDVVGLQEVQEVPCDWIDDDEAKEDSHHNAALIRELRCDIDRLRADNNELRDENSKMRNDTSQLCSQARVAFDKLDKKGRRIGHLEEENKTLRARIAELEAEKEEMSQAQANMQQQCLELRRQVELCPSMSPTSSVDDKVDGDTPIHGPCESEDTKNKLQQRDVEVAELQEELKLKLAQARATLEKKETRIASLQEEVDRERERRRGEVDTYEKKFRAELDRCDELERELRRARQVEVSSSSGELQSKLDEVAELKRLTDEAIQALPEQLADMTKERDELQLKCEFGDSEKQTLLQKVLRLEDRLQREDMEGVDSSDDRSNDQLPHAAGALGQKRPSRCCDDVTDDDSSADAINRNVQDYKLRMQKMRKRVIDWPGADISWASIIGVLIQIIKWRYTESRGDRPTSRYKSFQSTSVAFVAFFVAFGVGHVAGNVPLNEDEQGVVFENIDLIVAEIKEACDKDIIFDNANLLAINAKKHVTTIWQKLEDVKRSGKCIWGDSSETPKSKKNLHTEQVKLYESLFIEVKERQQNIDSTEKQREDATSPCKGNSRGSNKKSADDDVIVIE